MRRNAIVAMVSVLAVVFVSAWLAVWPNSMLPVFGFLLAGGGLVVAILSPFSVLLVLLGLVLPFQPFINFYFPAVGGVWMGAIARDGLAGLLVVGWLAGRLHRRGHFPPLIPVEKMALLYVAVMALYIPAAPSLEGALTGFRNLAGYIILMLVASDTINTAKRLRQVVWVLILSTAAVGVVAIAEVLTDRAVFAAVGYDMEALMGPDLPYSYLGLPRATGGTGNPLEFGLYVAIVATLCVAFLTEKVVVVRRGVLFPTLVVLAGALALTYARSAYVACLVGVCTALVLLRRFRVAVPLFGLLLVLLVMFYSPYGELLVPRLALQDLSSIETVESRIDVWDYVLRKGLSSWSGSGLGTQGASVVRAGVDPSVLITDNYYGSVLLQVGPLPALLFLIVFALLGRTFWLLRRTRADASTRAFAAGGLAMALMILANAGASSAFESRSISIAYWLLSGACLAFRKWPGLCRGLTQAPRAAVASGRPLSHSVERPQSGSGVPVPNKLAVDPAGEKGPTCSPMPRG